MEKQKGKGWHGNSQGHARAGREGGLARSKNLRERREAELTSTKESISDESATGKSGDVGEEDRIRSEITAYERELASLRLQDINEAVSYQIEQLENELRALRRQLDQAAEENIGELHAKVHELGLRIHSFRAESSAP
ncbi:MAG TPA: hypothetical protein VJJ82_01645 [Candidatus Nanoarchaeia archaeon]|nr:hypothetical protein [Candidatus Nanoarchaeia archaeon]